MERTKNKYIVFPIVMIVVTILNFLYPYTHSYIQYNSLEIMEIMDITGYTKIFSIIFLNMNVFVLLFCFYEGRKREKKGYNYSLNKMFTIIFIIFSTINIFAFIVIRNKEEKYTNELGNTVDKLFLEDNVYYLDSGNKNSKKTKGKSDFEIIQEAMENDKYYGRKIQIYYEMKKTPSKFERYFWLLIYWNYYNNDNAIVYGIRPSNEESYYAIYSIAITTNLICSAFYIKNINDKEIKEKTEIF